MADDNQNAEMEDILSSIKNILEEDEQSKSAAIKNPEDEPDVLSDVLQTSSDVDDILELSPEMRVADERALEPVISETAEDNADNAVDVVAAVTGEETADPFAVDADPTDFMAADSAVEPIAETEPVIEENAAPAEADVFELPAEPETVETSAVAEVEDFLPPVAEDTPIVEPTLSPEPETATVEPQSASLPAEDEADSSAAVVAETPLEDRQPLTEPEAAADSAVDVSANIISNFAKMFSRDDTPAPAASVAEPSVEIAAPGNTSKTLEEFVLDAVIKVVGGEIRRQWNDGAGFKSFAEAEIVRQTEKWINDNLPALVEKVVKQEIERVIAKVGS